MRVDHKNTYVPIHGDIKYLFLLAIKYSNYLLCIFITSFLNFTEKLVGNIVLSCAICTELYHADILLTRYDEHLNF